VSKLDPDKLYLEVIYLAKNKFRLSSLVLAALLLLSFVVVPFGQAQGAEDADARVLQEVREYVQQNFVHPVEASILQKDSVQEIVYSLNDPYSVYFGPEEYTEFQQATEQNFSGVGMQVELKGEYVTVVAPLKNTPASRAGIKSGDKVIAVDGQNVVGKPLETVVNMIKGEAGTSVVLTLQREGEKEPIILSLTRERIQLEVVESKLLEDSIGYIRLTTFSSNADDEFDAAIADLKLKGMRALVFDLRHNPGGYLTSGLSIASDFAPKDSILLHVVGRDGIKNSYKSLSPALGIPTVVLVDKGSASASEIVAGAIQDLGAGKLVGTQTFGKASVQTVFRLSNGGALKLTTAKYLTPKEREIHGVGLTPDYVVEGEEAQLAKAVELLKDELAKLPPEKEPLKITLALNKKEAQVGQKAVALDAIPYLRNGRTLVPLRFMAEAFGSQVSWDKSKQAVVIVSGAKRIVLSPGEPKALIDGKEVKLEAPAELVNGRSFVPLRFISESLGARVDFSSAKQEIYIVK
jgi:carboxyl-terminal processing protease